ncbi:hypothetical protein Cob_v008302 [Colletotrichum orbiculare MAFF 240422]|uniref:Uncharacterized protein n=1 Tax=Colletotrichum orbiculare (strain 104-T / ATCC 96160 / CBS 514.97 / LARS 414 / MAFF 240422) TaxID=1213857 RepID=A0A484FMB1_COLOR|nr:hypothetical protein Cob_v008302 [Colletotrichum orbiculare MAFF 240422]
MSANHDLNPRFRDLDLNAERRPSSLPSITVSQRVTRRSPANSDSYSDIHDRLNKYDGGRRSSVSSRVSAPGREGDKLLYQLHGRRYDQEDSEDDEGWYKKECDGKVLYREQFSRDPQARPGSNEGRGRSNSTLNVRVTTRNSPNDTAVLVLLSPSAPRQNTERAIEPPRTPSRRAPRAVPEPRCDYIDDIAPRTPGRRLALPEPGYSTDIVRRTPSRGRSRTPTRRAVQFAPDSPEYLDDIGPRTPGGHRSVVQLLDRRIIDAAPPAGFFDDYDSPTEGLQRAAERYTYAGMTSDEDGHRRGRKRQEKHEKRGERRRDSGSRKRNGLFSRKYSS